MRKKILTCMLVGILSTSLCFSSMAPSYATGKCEQVCPSASLRAYDASVEDKGIVVVSRSSEAAQATGAVSSEELASKRTVAVAQANAASPHTKGVHPDGPDATREAGA